MKIYDVRGIGANLTGSFSGSFNGLFAGTVEGVSATASYVEYTNVANKPALVSGSSQITYSGLTGIPSGIVSGSAQVAGFGIFATTGSNQFNGSQVITGSLTTTGTIVAQTLNVQQVTSSIVYSSGSNIFGNSVSNTQQLTGSVNVTGSLTVNGSGTFASSVTSNDLILIAGTLFGAGNTGFSNRLSDTTLYLQMPATGFNITDNALNTRFILSSTGAATFNLGSSEMRLNRTGTAEYLKLNTYYLLTDGNDQLLGSVTGATNIYAGSGDSPKLTIASTGAATFNTTATTAVSAISTGTASGLQLTNSGGTTSSWIIQSDGGAVAGQAALRFYSLTASAYRMSIDGSGNVGIGTTSPNLSAGAAGSTILTISATTSGRNGVLELNGTRTNSTDISGYVRFFNNGAATPLAEIRAIRGSSDTSGDLTIETSGGERMRITSAGNVIIGNTTAYGGLTVSDFTSNDGNDSLAFFYRGTSGGHESLIKFYDFRGQVNAAIGNNLEDDGPGTQKARLIFKTSYSGAPTERMQITSDGKISINNASTAYHQVAIKSNGVLTYNGLGVYSSSNDRWISINHTGTEGFVETENGGSGVMTPLSFKTGGSTRLTISSSGAATFFSSVQGANFITAGGNISMPTYSNFTTFYTVPNYQNAIYLVTLQLNGYSNYTAYATICQNDSALVIMNQVNNVAYIQVSGLNIQGSQNSGNTQNMVWRVFKIGS